MDNKYFNTLDILPLKQDDEGDTFSREIHPNLPDIRKGALVLQISKVKSGKTTRLVNMLCRQSYYKGLFDAVHIFSPTLLNDKTAKPLQIMFPNTIHTNMEDIDEQLNRILEYQMAFPKETQPKIAVIFDDYIGIKSKLAFQLATRFRHYNIKLLMYISQVFKEIPPMVRANATNVLVGMTTNKKELFKMAEEYGGSFGGDRKFLELYLRCVKTPFDFMYLDLQNNPPRCFRNFTELILVPKLGQDMNLKDLMSEKEKIKEEEDSE